MFNFFLLALSVARLTWLITEDHLPLVERPRTWIVQRKPMGSLAYLVNCWWCSSIYVAGGATAYAHWELNEPHALMWWPALSICAVALMTIVEILMGLGEDE